MYNAFITQLGTRAYSVLDRQSGERPQIKEEKLTADRDTSLLTQPAP